MYVYAAAHSLHQISLLTISSQRRILRVIFLLNVLKVMPNHHMGVRKYPKPSPASSLYFTFALNRPIFFSTNEIPMKRPEAIARTIPTILYHPGRSNSPAAAVVVAGAAPVVVDVALAVVSVARTASSIV